MAIDLTYLEEGTVRSGDGNGFSTGIIEEKVVGATSTSVTLTKAIPAYSEIESVLLEFDTAITLAGGSAPVKVGLGISGDPDSVILSGTAMTAGTITFGVPLTTKVVAANTNLIVAACATGGGADGNFTGTINVKVKYTTLSLPA